MLTVFQFRPSFGVKKAFKNDYALKSRQHTRKYLLNYDENHWAARRPY